MVLSLGKAVHEARRKAKKTLHGLGAEIGLSAASLSLIEQDKHVPPPEVIVRLAKHLDGDPDLWCAWAGRVSPEAEKKLADIARKDPLYFRTMLSRK